MTKKDCILIGFCGRKRSGKTTAASHLIMTTSLTSKQVSFADPIKQMASLIFGPINRHNKEAVRPALQAIGGCMRVLKGDDFWIRQSEITLHQASADGYRLVVIDDVRYPMEAEWIKTVGGHVIKITRPGQDLSDKHPSETSVDLVQADAEIINEKKLENFLAEVSNTCAMFGAI